MTEFQKTNQKSIKAQDLGKDHQVERTISLEHLQPPQLTKSNVCLPQLTKHNINKKKITPSMGGKFEEI